jgi:general L-amino acid transport system permease protein
MLIRLLNTSNLIVTKNWLHKNLFSSWGSALITIFCLYIVLKIIPAGLDWLFFSADFAYNFQGDKIIDRTFCSRVMFPGEYGACWAIVIVRWNQFMYGFYPVAEVWRVNIVFALTPLALLPLFFDKVLFKKQLIYFTFIFPFIAYYLLYGGPGLTEISTSKWGGLLVTLFLGLTGIIVAFPFSILLALGRRSKMPVIKSISVIFIECIRGVPLITILFFGNIMLPLFLPDGFNVDNLLRGLVAMTFFAAAYMAEAIRGGLQAIPNGQLEAARALGLSYWQSTIQIVLPQALRISIPAIVNSAIGVIKDTSLVLIVGLFDLLGIGRAALADMNWMKLSHEVYAFVAIIFFILCFSMSRYSLYLEKKLKTDNSI